MSVIAASGWVLQSNTDSTVFYKDAHPVIMLYSSKQRAIRAMRATDWPGMEKEFTPVPVDVVLRLRG